MESTVVAIEGITPSMLWTAIAVLVGAASIFLLIDKVANVFRERKKRQEEQMKRNSLPVAGIEERMTKLDESMEAIRSELSEVNRKLDRDNRRINDLEHGQIDIGNGFKALCTASIALLNHSINDGNTEEMERAKDSLMNYLQDRWSRNTDG